ncbi:oxidoreductase [Achromatium sp. WMS2]|nr:oxidoreductase [Achromatium sp. WMS2]
MANLSEYDTSKTWQAVLASSQRITADSADEVRNLTLHIPDAGFNYQVGQSIGVIVPGPHPFGNNQHLRLYSIAGESIAPNNRGVAFDLCVRRCFYIDEVSGERYPGIASNHLCDAKPGAAIKISGPYGSHFKTPEDNSGNLLMIGTGTGIAPFRAFLKRVYQRHGEWKGQVRLYYGARTGMEMLYRNDKNADLTLYYDQDTFKAFEALSRKPWLGEENAIEQALQHHAQDVWNLMQDDNTFVYLAGLEKISTALDAAMSQAAKSANRWRWLRQEMMEQGRWAELLYS